MNLVKYTLKKRVDIDIHPSAQQSTLCGDANARVKAVRPMYTVGTHGSIQARFTGQKRNHFN